MRTLDRASRALLAGLAFATFAGSFVATPIVARGEADQATPLAALATPVPVPSGAPNVAVRRDPFIGGTARSGNGAGTAASSRMLESRAAFPPGAAMPPMPQVPPLPTIPATLLALPPNAGAAHAPLPFATTTARVTAVVTGEHAFALVDEAGTTRLVTVGDRVAGDAVAAITAAGVRLEHGRLLTVTPASSPRHL